MSFSLTILGSSSAVPTSERFPAAHVINIHERYFLADCGEGTQIQLRKNRIGFGRINHILISHVHGDHTFGLFGLISTFSLLGRKSDLHIYAHPILESILNDNRKYYYEYPLPFKIIFHPLGSKKKELIYQDEKLEIQTIPLRHRIPSCGFLFREKAPLLNLRKEMITYHKVPVKEMMNIKKGQDFINENGRIISNKILTLPPLVPRSLAYCSDTKYTESILPQIKNVNILYHEATYLHNMSGRAAETGHSTAKQAGMIAAKASVQKLIIGHFSARYKTTDELVEEARKEFPETYAANEGDCHAVEQKRFPGSESVI
ncbi:MAG: ribonuclease Z [Bacteroidales bacterium]